MQNYRRKREREKKKNESERERERKSPGTTVWKKRNPLGSISLSAIGANFYSFIHETGSFWNKREREKERE